MRSHSRPHPRLQITLAQPPQPSPSPRPLTRHRTLHAASLIQYGLTSCHEGFGWERKRYSISTGQATSTVGLRNCDQPASTVEAGPTVRRVIPGAIDRSSADGVLSYVPTAGANASASEIVDELGLLLTAGRLSHETRAVLEEEYARARDGGTFILATTKSCAAWQGRNATDITECAAAAEALGYGIVTPVVENYKQWQPRGCYYHKVACTAPSLP